MNPLFRIDFSISDSLKIVRKSVLIYETIIYHVTSKPGKAKAVAQHCEEIPEFITELKNRLEMIEIY